MKRFCGSYVLFAGALGFCVTGAAIGNPTAPVVVSGQVSFQKAGNLLPTTNGPGAIINWQSFAIRPNEVSHSIQQSANSTVLNRVTGGNPSMILGVLQSNPRVFLIDPGGTVFGSNTTAINTGVIAPGKSVELSDPKSPNIKVEVKAPANRAVNVQQLVDSLGKRDVTSLLTTGAGIRAATMAVRDEAGRIVLKAAP
jgi:filamentous hemagglutinin family protein